MLILLGLVTVQAACAAVFVSDILVGVLGLRAVPLAWSVRELIEIGAAVGLVLGTILGALALRQSERRRRKAEQRFEAASGAFMELVETRFEDWGLTPAERDVALFALKGQALSDIARLRGTSEGTVKAQSAAIYRKAGVSSRAQLVSLFVEDLMEARP
ncbi:helix-turn-helix transcriptional regulator [Jannaschia ovalis]|uniref:LuxR C-terminal-related transcriptional regulator n=1 Tax=Jannaschia ovalis TaxID=3038773 RepID=A0ABY8LBL2_9RHOB|nr:LuxR C-terminal-related transcriptional regulator [Jannaschia sp. GRR-S6-38]WGH77778.1 LuxR C-terminal-related transcriptional regulator [Jannaschia sp. GRR-S6-38]